MWHRVRGDGPGRDPHPQFAVCSADSAHAAEWTAIVLRTDGSGVVCGGDSGYLASLGRVAGVVENESSND